jgi:hypothetical protein
MPGLPPNNDIQLPALRAAADARPLRGWKNLDVVTGAFGYIGKYISKALLERGRTLCTITTHPNKLNPFGPTIRAFSYNQGILI